MKPDTGIPAQLAFNIILGTFLAISALIAARRPVRRRFGRHQVHGRRSRPNTRPVGYDTMRVRARTDEPASANNQSGPTGHDTTMELAA